MWQQLIVLPSKAFSNCLWVATSAVGEFWVYYIKKVLWVYPFRTGQIQHPEFCEYKVCSAPFGSECTSEGQTILFRSAPELGSRGWYQGKLKCYQSFRLIFRFVFHIKQMCGCYSFWLDSRNPKRIILTDFSILYVAFLERTTSNSSIPFFSYLCPSTELMFSWSSYSDVHLTCWFIKTCDRL